MEAVHIASGSLGIAHTRWATHGEPSERNSHPHQSGSTTLVHNGIIENYNELKKELENAGYTFQSDTDSEIACAYIDYCYFLKKDKQQALAGQFSHIPAFPVNDYNQIASYKYHSCNKLHFRDRKSVV